VWVVVRTLETLERDGNGLSHAGILSSLFFGKRARSSTRARGHDMSADVGMSPSSHSIREVG
jgi:hypothetical protein